MMATVTDTLTRLYPTRTWGELDDLAAQDPDTAVDVSALADELAQELDAATFVRLGEEDEYCDFVYVLCVGRPPCLIQVRDAAVPIPDEWTRDTRVTEHYLRVCVSRLAPLVGVQQVAIDLLPGPDGFAICESSRAGVYDAPFLRRFQRLVAVLPAYDVVHLDFGDISAPPPGYAGGTWGQLYGGEPAVANYFFYPQPATTEMTTWIDHPLAGP